MTDTPASAPRKRRKRPRALRRFARSNFALSAMSMATAGGLRFINATTRTTFEPADPDTVFGEYAPMIITAWHGQAFMLPLLRPKNFPCDVLASRHSDGELIARTLVRLGNRVIRGSGSADASRMHERGAVASFRAMKAALDAGRSVVLTADFDRSAPRRAGMGLVSLARLTGRPLMPVAIVSSRRREIGSSWDRTTVSLPFGRAHCVMGPAIVVARDASPDEQEEKRIALESALNAAQARAMAEADRRG